MCQKPQTSATDTQQKTPADIGGSGDGNEGLSKSFLCDKISSISGTYDLPQLVQAKENLTQTILYGSLSMFFLIGGVSICMPYSQSRRDELQCDALCQGSMMSARSFLHLIGAAVLGRLSDGGGILRRKRFMYLGALGSIINLVVMGTTFSIRGLWWSIVFGSLLQQNMSILKAIVVECYEVIDCLSTEDDIVDSKNGSSSSSSASAAVRASGIGKIGMSVGLAFMFGPLLGGRVVKNFDHAVALGIVLVMFSVLLASKIPDISDDTRISKSTPTPTSSPTSSWFQVPSFLQIKAARTPAAIFFMIIRTSMSLAFHIFNTIWAPSLNRRFQFGPADYGQFFSFIGVSFALAQGFVAGKLIQFFGPNRRITLIATCCVALGVGRWFAFQTNSLSVVYVLFFFIITALGVLNTIITADTSKIASPDEIGGFLGLLDAVESGAGMAGPIIGGLLGKVSLSSLRGDTSVISDGVAGTTAPLLAVVSLYFFIFLLVIFGYDKYVAQGQNNVKTRMHHSNDVADTTSVEGKKDI